MQALVLFSSAQIMQRMSETQEDEGSKMQGISSD